jgi:WD40 repeat protein
VPYLPGLVALETQTRSPIPVENCPSAQWYDLAQAPNGQHAVLVSEKLLAILAPGPPPHCTTLVSLSNVLAADIDSSGTRIALGFPDQVQLIDPNGTTLWSAPHPLPGPLDIAISADGLYVASGGKDHLARLWDTTGTLKAIFPGHMERVASVDFRPDGQVLATGSWDGSARLWLLSVLELERAHIDTLVQQTWGLSLEDAL